MMGSVNRPELLDPRVEALRTFVCATHRARTAAVEYSAELERVGFNRAQIEAVALLSA
jgi:hypothetical protein